MPRRAVILLLLLLVNAPAAVAQSVEISPFGGYRFGGDPFEVVAGRALDIDYAPALGLTIDFPLSGGMQIEGFFSHQRASVPLVVEGALGGPARLGISVDHWQVGGLQEFGAAWRTRPFLTGMLGLTRYGIGADNEIRFSAGAGGGVKLFPTSHFGIRLDGRALVTILDAGGTALACGSRSGTCLVALHVDAAWQAEFTAGLLVRFR
jgi:hypothetical protein